MRLGKRVFVRLSVCVAALALVAGCQHRPSRVAAPSWDPEGFADAIVAKLDKNSDGAVDLTEVDVAPGLAWGAQYIDTDKNKSISRDELVARFTLYEKMRIGITTKTMQVTYKGRPVVGAKINLVPEFFLEGIVESASGETAADGTVIPQTQGTDLPGIRVGCYRVVIDAPSAKLPAKYSSADTTTAGVEVSPTSDDPRSYGTIQIALRD
jgi:hypothetical protein